MENSVRKWGNSLGLRIPSTIAAELGIQSGTAVSLTVEGQSLQVRVAVRKAALVYGLAELVNKISRSNRHGEIETGSRRGNEAW
jgi:antitoxin MazE